MIKKYICSMTGTECNNTDVLLMISNSVSNRQNSTKKNSDGTSVVDEQILSKSN